MDSKIFIFVFFVILKLTIAEVVPFKACPNNVGKCTIHEVRITPCPEALEKQPCKIKRGRSANMEFDYTPEFDAETVQGNVYWASEIDLPFVGMDTEGCKFTKCPLVKNEKQTYSFNIDISKKFPLNTYDIKWRLIGKEPEQECCFITFIKLTR